MKECILSDGFYDLEILMIGWLKPEYYIRKNILFLNFLTKFYMAKKRPIRCPQIPIESN